MIAKMKQELFRIQYTPSGNVAAGDVVVIGSRYVCIATQDITAATLGSIVVAGKAEVVKYGAVSGTAWTSGQKIYYDESEEEFTHVATANLFAGIVPPDGAALSAATSGLLLFNVFTLDDAGEPAAHVTRTQDALTLTAMSGTANTSPAAETNLDTVGGTLTGTLDQTLADVSGTFDATAIATINKNFKELQAQLTKQKALNTVLINNIKTFATQLNKAGVDVKAIVDNLITAGIMATS